jgi:hypothetical protein
MKHLDDPNLEFFINEVSKYLEAKTGVLADTTPLIIDKYREEVARSSPDAVLNQIYKKKIPSDYYTDTNEIVTKSVINLIKLAAPKRFIIIDENIYKLHSNHPIRVVYGWTYLLNEYAENYPEMFTY